MTYESTAETITFVHGQADENTDPDKKLKTPAEGAPDAAPGEDGKVDGEGPSAE